MPVLLTKVPRPRALAGVPTTVLALAVVAGGCGGDVESAPTDEIVRMIPPAEAVAEPAAEPASEAAEAPAPDAPPVEEAEPAPAELDAAGDADADADGVAAPAPRPGTGIAAPPAAPETRPRKNHPAGDRGTSERPVPVRAPVRDLGRSDPGPPSPTPEPDVVPEPIAVPAGVRLEATMVRGLSTKTTRAGDRFEARLVDDVLGATGIVLLPRGATLVGRVLESRESAGAESPAVLTLVPEAVVADGATRPLEGRIVELDVEADARDSGTSTAAKVGVGAAAGAVLGKIIGGDDKDALKGAAAGAAAGAAVALATKSGHATVAEGARIVVMLAAPLVIAGR